MRRVNLGRLEDLCVELLLALGEDPNRAGLLDTPRRWASWWQAFAEYSDESTPTTFESVQVDQLVVVRAMPFASICEHHLLPFAGTCSIGYLSGNRVLGLSKFARIMHVAAHRLQLQERLASDIADRIADATAVEDVAVLVRATHTCMTMRGIRTPGEMVTSVVRGRFRDDAAARAEFMELAR